jgi:hypothetical protein
MSDGRLLEPTPPTGEQAAPETGLAAPESPEVEKARAAHTTALRAHERAASQLAKAVDAVDDAEGALRTAEVKAEDYDDDETKKPWQRVAAGEGVAKAERALERLRADLQARRDDVAEAAAAVLLAERSMSDAVAAAAEQLAAAEAAEAAERKPVYANVDEWVNKLLLTHYRRPFNGGSTKWCPHWWEHAEAVARLEACWRAWEHLRHEGATGPAVWFRDYFDPMMAVLTSTGGPFHACGPNPELTPHKVPDQWPVIAPPAHLFRAADHPEEQ